MDRNTAMVTTRNDPWAILESGFESYAGPRTDGFEPRDTQASDLGTWLRGDVVGELLGATHNEENGVVSLPNGFNGQMSHKESGEWVLMVPLKRRDWVQVFTGHTRAEAVRIAREYFAGNVPTQDKRKSENAEYRE
jgi:hypothetical protein